jgi:WD40 repeat protein
MPLLRAAGDRLVSCSADQQLRLWQLVDGVDSAADGKPADPRFVPDGPPTAGVEGVHTRCIYALDWSHTHHRIATGGADDTLRVFVPAEMVGESGRGLVLEVRWPHSRALAESR